MSADVRDNLVIPKRFCGPPESGNGGWVSGSLAQRLEAAIPVTVRLRTPPPLERPITITSTGPHRLQAKHGQILVAEAEQDEPMPVPHLPKGITYQMAEAAGEGFRGLTEHPFPMCFSCGTDRAEDGLGLRTGPLPGHPGYFGTAWTPTEVTLPITWAALDCPGGWAADVGSRPMVLGTMTAQLEALPEAGRPYVIVSWTSGEEGRKVLSQCVLVDADYRLIGQSMATWIMVDPASVRPH